MRTIETIFPPNTIWATNLSKKYHVWNSTLGLLFLALYLSLLSSNSWFIHFLLLNTSMLPPLPPQWLASTNYVLSAGSNATEVESHVLFFFGFIVLAALVFLPDLFSHIIFTSRAANTVPSSSSGPVLWAKTISRQKLKAVCLHLMGQYRKCTFGFFVQNEAHTHPIPAKKKNSF